MEENKKFCKHCGEQIDKECIICPKCGKQVEEIKTSNPNPNIIINNSNNNTNTATATSFGGAGTFDNTSPKSKIVTLILCIFVGYLGIHRFYVGKVGSGIIYFFTGGGFMIGWIYDIIKILSGTFTDGSGLVIRK